MDNVEKVDVLDALYFYNQFIAENYVPNSVIDVSGLAGEESLNKYLAMWLRGADPANPLKDECGNIFVKSGGGDATLTSRNAVAGNAIQINGVYETYDIELGGKDFTVEGRLGNAQDTRAAVAFHIWRTGESFTGLAGGIFGFDEWDNGGEMMLAWYVATGASGGSSASPAEAFHFAFCYNHAENLLRCFVNGVLITLGNVSIERAKYTIQMGTGGKTLEQFRVFDGISRWNENFTPPNDYSLSTKKLCILLDGKKYVVEAREAYLGE